MLLGLHRPVKVWLKGRAVSMIFVGFKVLNQVAGECRREYMVQTGSNPVRLFTTAGLSSILSPATLESLVTNADGTTSLITTRIRVRVPVVPQKWGP